MSFFQFVKSKLFFKNLLAIVIVTSLLTWVAFKYLNNYTLHGEAVAVPDFSGVSIYELDDFITEKNVRYTIIDSIYDTKKPKGVVISQDPEPNAMVKTDRIIYLYVTALVPPKVLMPKLKDRSLRQAAAILETYGLKVGKIKFIPDQCANCVLQQLHKGEKIEPGTAIEKNTTIDLVVGKGLSDEEVAVPIFIGLSLKDALYKITEASLNEGLIQYDNPKDSSISKVYRQIPPPSSSNYVKMGSSVDLFLTSDESKIKIPILDTAATEELE